MTAIRARDIRHHKFTSADQLFIDANVWLAVYGPPGMSQDWKTRVYSSAIDTILKTKSAIFLDVLVLSEFVNAYARYQFRITEVECSYKAYRESEDFKPVASSIATAVRRILGVVNRVPTGFPNVDMDHILSDFMGSSRDINDQLIGEACLRNGWTLITDDADFAATSALSILTANRRLLQAQVAG